MSLTSDSAGSELVEKSAVELRRLIGSKAISPVELLDACIARIERVNPLRERGHRHLLRACPRPRRARLKARSLPAHPLGLLHGLPVGVKDLEATQAC